MKQKEFIEMIGPKIKYEAETRGYRFPSAIICQAILESNYGKSGLSAQYNNFFGLKCGRAWKGGSVNMKTKEEYTPGTLTEIKDNFRTYDSIDDGIRGYFDFIGTKRYENLKRAKSSINYIELLKQDGYFTSSTYIDSCKKLLDKWNLTTFDGAYYQPSERVERSIDEIAQECIDGLWGNGAARKAKLHRAGYRYNEVQARVNEILRGD